ncbi:hypothetical protein GQ600_16911 [Phytophthora cactorum]|nr:hypothetical protein GQ600_16911 [Phytophthora cactorum]
MVSTTVFVAAVAAVATSIGQVQAHGYMEKPLAEFKEGTESPSAWVAEIAPQWKGDWDKAKGDEGLVALYKELKKSNNIKDIRTMIDGDPKLYGEACGNTDRRRRQRTAGKPIWLDDEMVLQNDDCQSAYGDGTKKTISVF